MQQESRNCPLGRPRLKFAIIISFAFHKADKAKKNVNFFGKIRAFGPITFFLLILRPPNYFYDNAMGSLDRFAQKVHRWERFFIKPEVFFTH